MHDPDSYDVNSEFQRKDALELIPRLVSDMSWRKGEHVLDFGCGSGAITKNILLPAMDKEFPDESRTIYATDISAKMIEFSKLKYPHGQVNYFAMDIFKEYTKLECKFDKIFSFHTLHWIPDIRKLLEIFYELLNPGGEIGLYFIGTAPVFSTYDTMQTDAKWSSYLHDTENYIPRTFYSPDPAGDMKQLLELLNFQVQQCSVVDRNFHFHSSKEMIDAAMAANPFVQRIPQDEQSAYREDFQATMMTYVDFAPTPDWPDRLNVSYQENFWRCMNETMAAVEEGTGWEGRQCCSTAITRQCQMACLTAKRSSDLSKGCRRSDEIPLYHCLAKQKRQENCCRQSRKAECVTACRNYLKETPGQPNRRHGLKKRLNSQCEREQSVLGCVANLTQGTPVQNPERNLPCCSYGRSEQCQQTCWHALKSGHLDVAVFETLERDCGHPRPDDKMWQCFLQNAEPRRAEPPSKIDRLGMDAAKLHCCHRAASPACRRLCHKTYSREWTGSWSEFNQMCLSNPKERDLRDCVDEVEEPCELGCDGLNFCSAFNNRPSELFRRCNAAADLDARQQYETWKSLGYIPFMENMRLPLKNISYCAPEKWKAVACALQIRPCHPRNHASMICRADCNSLLHQCINLDALAGRINIESICDFISPPPEEPCVRISSYVKPPKVAAADRKNDVTVVMPQITRPCKNNPCNLTDTCEVNRHCPFSGLHKCEPYKCTLGCTLGEVSRMVVPPNTWVRVPQDRVGCQRLCRCGAEGRMENCVASFCEPSAPCWLGKNHFEHGSKFYLGCNLCSCRSGELACSRRQCPSDEEEESGFLFPSSRSSGTDVLPCGCPNQRAPVCGSNGRTFPSHCLAKCAGLSDIDIYPGECASRDPCEGVSCGNGRRCIRSQRVCLLGRHCPQFQCVPLKCEESWHRRHQPVCDTSGREHRNLCSLATAGAMLAYTGPCLRTGCSSEGPICGVDGETYPSECAAEARGMPTDYHGPCRFIGTGDGNYMKPSCGKSLVCPALPSNCIGVTPPGACCPMCGGVLQVIYSPQQVLRLAEVTDSQLITIDDISEKLNLLVQTAQCKVGAYLGLGPEIIVLVKPVSKSWTTVQLQACVSEAERLAAFITQQNPAIQVDATLSVLTAAIANHIASHSVVLHYSLGFLLTSLFLLFWL